MKAAKFLQRGVVLWRRRSDDETGGSAQESTNLPDLCPVAICERCGYEFVPYTVSAVCPRCLEPFSRDPCYGSCFSCPLLPAASDTGE
jgi:predicted amidophosphoribosyltransferase